MRGGVHQKSEIRDRDRQKNRERHAETETESFSTVFLLCGKEKYVWADLPGFRGSS